MVCWCSCLWSWSQACSVCVYCGPCLQAKLKAQVDKLEAARLAVQDMSSGVAVSD
jgi:hypothetical protein